MSDSPFGGRYGLDGVGEVGGVGRKMRLLGRAWSMGIRWRGGRRRGRGGFAFGSATDQLRSQHSRDVWISRDPGGSRL